MFSVRGELHYLVMRHSMALTLAKYLLPSMYKPIVKHDG